MAEQQLYTPHPDLFAGTVHESKTRAAGIPAYTLYWPGPLADEGVGGRTSAQEWAEDLGDDGIKPPSIVDFMVEAVVGDVTLHLNDRGYVWSGYIPPEADSFVCADEDLFAGSEGEMIAEAVRCQSAIFQRPSEFSVRVGILRSEKYRMQYQTDGVVLVKLEG